MPYPQTRAPATLASANGMPMGPLKNEPPTFVMTPTSAPHQGPRTMAATHVPIMSRNVGSLSAVLIVDPTMLSAAAAGTNATTSVSGIRLVARVGTVAAVMVPSRLRTAGASRRHGRDGRPPRPTPRGVARVDGLPPDATDGLPSRIACGTLRLC